MNVARDRTGRKHSPEKVAEILFSNDPPTCFACDKAAGKFPVALPPIEKTPPSHGEVERKERTNDFRDPVL
jgi:hypothetical protein